MNEATQSTPGSGKRSSSSTTFSTALYRLGRLAARRPWTVIGSWLVVSVLVIGASALFGQELEDKFEVPGLDSQQALDLLVAAQSDTAGLTAQVVLTPLDDDVTFFDSLDAQAALTEVQAAAAALPKVLGTSDPAGALAAGPEAAAASGAISPDGRIALIRIQYPVIDELNANDLETFQIFGDLVRVGSPLQIELAGDLFFSFEEPETGIGEMIGLIAAVIILLLAFGSLIAMGLPIGMALFGLALGVSSLSVSARSRCQLVLAHQLSRRYSQLGTSARKHDRARSWHRLRPIPRDSPS